MDARKDLIIIDLNTTPVNLPSPADKFHACERDLETILARIDDLQPIFSRFDEDDDVRQRREQQAVFIGYLSLFLTLSSFILWITAKSLSDTNSARIVDNCQTAVMLLGLLSSGAYIYRKTAPDNWPIKLRTLTCSLSSDDLQPLTELKAALAAFKQNMNAAYSVPENPDYQIAKLIDGNIQSVINALEDKAVTIRKARENFTHLQCIANAAKVLFQKAPDYVPRKNAINALSFFAPAAVNNRTTTSNSESAPLLGK